MNPVYLLNSFEHKIKSVLGKLFFSILLLLLFSQTSCKKFVETGPPTSQMTGASIYESDASAITVLNGVYTNLSSNNDFACGMGGVSFLGGLSSDELVLYQDFTVPDARAYYYGNALYANVPGRTPGTETWSSLYSYLFACNSAIAGITNSKGLTVSVRQQLLGEAKFLRAFFYFYLVNLYGDVPLVLTSDYKSTSNLARASRSDVYQQIISDLTDAESMLSDKFLDQNMKPYVGVMERVRPTKWAAVAMLSRVYLYNSDWANAEAESTALINKTDLFELELDLNSVFLKNSREAIWQLQPTWVGWNTEDAKTFIITPMGFNYDQPVYLNENLTSAFESGDTRKTEWIGEFSDGVATYNFPYKYKSATLDDPLTEYLMVLRVGEQYLIRAEARAQQNKITEAQDDLNTIRSRAQLNATTANDKSSLLTAILQERRVELFSEWGHRWLDLKRQNRIDDVMKIVLPQKNPGQTWQQYKQWYPLPLDDISKDPNLIQNTGY